MKGNNITIAYFALGSVLKFSEKKLLRSNGTNEYFVLANLLLKNRAITKIVLLSRSDWSRITQTERDTIDPHHKIFDPYSQIKSLGDRQKKQKKQEMTPSEQRTYYMSFHEVLKDIHIDFGLGFVAQGWGTVSMPGFLNNLKPPYRPAKTLFMSFWYASEAIYYLGKTKLPWFLLATDPRYVKPSMRHRDTINIPKKILGQQDFDIKWFHAKELKRDSTIENDDFITEDTKSFYTGIEKINLINDSYLIPTIDDKPEQFSIVSMQLSAPGSVKDSRFDILKEYILDRDVNQHARIYGKWSDHYKKGYPQFKGYIATEDLDKTFLETRYTLVLPTDAGWVTSKYAEMLQLGVIPFFHPKYDTQYHVVSKDHLLRLKDADDFYKKMTYFDANPKERIDFVSELQTQLISNAYSGKFFIELLNNSLQEHHLDIQLDISNDSLYEKRNSMKSIENKKESNNALTQFFYE